MLEEGEGEGKRGSGLIGIRVIDPNSKIGERMGGHLPLYQRAVPVGFYRTDTLSPGHHIGERIGGTPHTANTLGDTSVRVLPDPDHAYGGPRIEADIRFPIPDPCTFAKKRTVP
jgi:hypothetical protein